MNIFHRAVSARGWPGRGLDLCLGALTVLGFAPFHIWPIAILALAGFAVRLDQARKVGTSGFWTGFWFAFGLFLCGMFWIGSAFITRGPEYIPAMVPMVGGLAVLLAIFWGIAGWVYARFAGHGPARWACLAGLIFLAEFARGHLFGGFPWNLLGYIFESGSPMSQAAAYIGIYGLTFSVLVMAICLAICVQGKNIVAGAALLVLCAVQFGFGYVRLSGAQVVNAEGVTLRIVQVPFSQKDKFDRNKSLDITNDFLKLSMESGLDTVTHVIWPEGAVVGLALEDRALISAAEDVLRSADDTPPIWLMNTLRHEMVTGSNGESKDIYFNSSVALDFTAPGTPRLAAQNDKWRLVPFGEFIPGGEFVENLGAKILSVSLGSISPAPRKDLSDFPGLPKTSPQICYEIIFSGLTPRRQSEYPAQWILNQSNDAWYGQSIGPAQHANIAAYRAIEEGIPVVRSASNGVSGVVDPYGRWTGRLEPAARGVLDVSLPKGIGTSLSRYHNLFIALIVFIITILSGVFSRRRSLK